MRPARARPRHAGAGRAAPRASGHPRAATGRRAAGARHPSRALTASIRGRRSTRTLARHLMSEAPEHDRTVPTGHGIAHAFWLRAPGCGEIRPVGLPEPGPDDVVVRTLRSGVSRGTETLVF